MNRSVNKVLAVRRTENLSVMYTNKVRAMKSMRVREGEHEYKEFLECDAM